MRIASALGLLGIGWFFWNATTTWGVGYGGGFAGFCLLVALVIGGLAANVRLQARVAGLLGKERALWVPSGTMANQVALKILTHHGDEVVLGQETHMVWHEAGAGAANSGVQFMQIGQGGLFSPEEFRLAVNFSSAQFTRADAPSVVAGALKRSGLEPHRLDLEILDVEPEGHAVQLRHEARAHDRDQRGRDTDDDIGLAPPRLRRLDHGRGHAPGGAGRLPAPAAGARRPDHCGADDRRAVCPRAPHGGGARCLPGLHPLHLVRSVRAGVSHTAPSARGSVGRSLDRGHRGCPAPTS